MDDPQHFRDVLTSSPLLLTPEEAAWVLRIGRTTIYALMKSGDLRPVHIGRSCRLPRAELERYVRCLETPSETAPTSTGKLSAARSSQYRPDATRRGMRSQ
jgi:excisionase family DNA binding protein